MKSVYENIYCKLPPALQNAAVSFAGLKEHILRYGGIYRDYSASIAGNLEKSKDELIELQQQQLRRILSDAIVHVPYYTKTFAGVLDPVKIENFSISGLHTLPLLDKTTIRSAPGDFINKKYTCDKLKCIHTTGSTGTPLNIKCTPEVRQKNYAFFSRFLQAAGIEPAGRRVTIGGRIVVPHTQTKPPYWRLSYFQRSLLFSSYHITDENMDLYISRLRTFRPSYIDTYPSSLYFIAEYAKRKGISLTGITKAIITSAETLFDYQRELIEEIFGVPIYDQYGAAEMCIFVGQCKSGNYHIHSDYGIVEFIKDDGSPALPGEEGEIVCTGFINPVMPLIRYRIGDRGILSEEKCTCNCNFPVLKNLLGRIDDVIITPDGKKVGRLSPVLKGFPVREAQYVQEKLDEVIVNIVKDSGYNEHTECDIIIELRKRLGNVIGIKVRQVESITRGKGNKLKSIVSKLKAK